MIQQLFYTIFNSMIAHAQTASSPDDYKIPEMPGSVTDPSKVDLQTVTDFVELVLSLLLKFAGILALVLIIYSGLMYALSYGDEAKMETAKKTIVWAIIGLVVVMLASFIVNFISEQLKS